MLVINFFCYYSNRLLSPALLMTFVINMMKYGNLAVTLTSVFLYIYFDWIPILVPIAFLSTNILVAGFQIGLSSLPRTYVDGQVLDFFEGIQFLLLFIKLTQIWDISWYWTLFPYQCFIWFISFVGYISAFFFPLMYGIMTVTPEYVPQYFGIRMAVWVFSHVFYKSLAYYYLFYNFRLYLLTNKITSEAILTAPSSTLVPMLYFMLIGGLANMVWFFYQKKWIFKMISMKTMIVTNTKGVKRDYLSAPLDMNIVQAGTNFFKMMLSRKNIPDPENDVALETNEKDIDSNFFPLY